MADPIAMIQAVADATANVSKEITERSELNNQPDLQAALVIHRIQTVLDAQRQAISDENLAQVRTMVAASDAGNGS